MKIIKILFSALLLFSAACSSTTQNVSSSNDEMNIDAASMLERINDFNAKAADSCDMNFVVEGFIGKQTYKVNGTAQFDVSLPKFYCAFTDFVFKSPLSQVFCDENEVLLYFPSEKRLFRNNAKTMTFSDYGNINLEYKLVYLLFTGKIPLIENYKVKDVAVESGNNFSYLILENRKYYQTIAFKGDIPDRLKFTDKNNGGETEFYFSNWGKYGVTLLAKRLYIVSKEANTRLNVIIGGVKINTFVKVKGIDDIKIPADTAVINK